ncbi:MAG: glycosyltransferase, partial [Spirochaetes bacterium]|nr:glycosyltransferase [Spirochaetota bacterium]
MSLSILIPAYNEGNCIKQTLMEIEDILGNSDIKEYEILVIDDGSSDNTRDELLKSNSSYNLITHSQNKGYGASLKTGL